MPDFLNTLIPPEDFDKPVSTPRDMIALAVEVAKAAENLGALQVIANLRERFGSELVPVDLDPSESPIAHDAIPFLLTDPETGAPLVSMNVDPTDDIIRDNFITMRDWGREWIRNMGLCAPLVNADHERLGDACQAHTLDLSRVRDPTQAVICGSGASLDAMTELLPAFPGLIICGPSNASACAAAGAPPHAILAIDSGLGTIAHLMGVPFDSLGSTLITSTSIKPDVAEMFPLHRKWFTSIIQMGRGSNHPFNVFSAMLFPFLHSFMFQAGCTVNAEILFLQMLREMQKVEFSAVYLLGVDFCYRENAARCSAFALRDNGSYEKRDAGLSSSVPHVRSPFVRSFNGLVTDRSMLDYKRSLLTVWVITQLPLYDCSDGIITEVPRADFASFCSGQRPPAYSQQSIFDSYNAYLSRIGYQSGKSAGSEGTEIQGGLWERS